MKNSILRRMVLLGLVLTLGGLPAPADDDVVIKRVGDETTEVSGTIIEDSYKQVVVKDGAAKIPIKCDEVVEVIYDQAPREFEKIEDALEDESFAEAKGLLGSAYGRLKRIQGAQQNLLKQYFFHYAALVSHRVGDYERARKAYGGILTAVKDSRFYFVAKLGEAKTYEEEGDYKKALDAYTTGRLDFEKKYNDEKIRWAKPYEVAAEMGQIRMKVRKAMGEKNKDEIRSLEKELDTLVRQSAKYLNDEAKEAAKQTKGLIWRGLEQWEDFVRFLDKEVMEAQLKDRKQKLFRLYEDRADANFALAEFRAAALDYLRLALLYDAQLQGEKAARTHFRLGKCFSEMKIKEDDWIKQAKKHFAYCKHFNSERWNDHAKQELKKLKELESGDVGTSGEENEENG